MLYGLGLSSGIGIIPVLLLGALALTATGWICALRCGGHRKPLV